MNVADRVREKMSNLHAIYHHADGDDDDQVGVPPYIILHLLTYSIHSIPYPPTDLAACQAPLCLPYLTLHIKPSCSSSNLVLFS